MKADVGQQSGEKSVLFMQCSAGLSPHEFSMLSQFHGCRFAVAATVDNRLILSLLLLLLSGTPQGNTPPQMHIARTCPKK